MTTFSSFIFVVLLLVIIGQLAFIAHLLRNLYKATKLTEMVDPLFPAFNKETVYRSKVKHLLAKQKAEDAHHAAWVSYQDGGKTINDKLKKDFAETQSELTVAEEELHRMIQGNIAVLNGKNISEVLDEFRKWLTSRVIRRTTDVEKTDQI